jgi:hypothetical protein
MDDANIIITQCARDLIALNDNNPKRWKQLFARAIKPAPKKRGPEMDADKFTAIAKDITLERNKLWRVRAKQTEGIKTKSKKLLAEKHGVSVRKVERVSEAVRDYLNKREMPSDIRQPILEGIASAMSKEIQKSQDADHDERLKENRRRFPDLYAHVPKPDDK